MADPGFWNDQNAAREVIDDANKLKAWSDPWNELNAKAVSLGEMLELLEGEDDPEMLAEVERDARSIGPAMADLELRMMLQGPDDGRAALVTIHPGAGGTESQDWAEMLARMYQRWADRHGFSVEL